MGIEYRYDSISLRIWGYILTSAFYYDHDNEASECDAVGKWREFIMIMIMKLVNVMLWESGEMMQGNARSPWKFF